jgi:hypothetical protein
MLRQGCAAASAAASLALAVAGPGSAVTAGVQLSGASARPGEKIEKLAGRYELSGKWIDSSFAETPAGSPYERTWLVVPDPDCSGAACEIPVASQPPSGERLTFTLRRANAYGSGYAGTVPVKDDIKCRKGKGPWVKVKDGAQGFAQVEIVVKRTARVKHVLRVTRFAGRVLVKEAVQPRARQAGCPGEPLLALAVFTGELASY